TRAGGARRKQGDHSDRRSGDGRHPLDHRFWQHAPAGSPRGRFLDSPVPRSDTRARIESPSHLWTGASMDASHALLKELCDGFGPPGHESEIAGMMQKHLRGLGEVSRDGLGSVICRKKGSADEPRVLVAGHMDEVGFMVKGITPEGFIKFLPMGGWWGHVVLAQKVRIRTQKGDV